MSEDEKVYLDESGVTVTKARFIVQGQTHAMSGVTSVKALVDQPLKGPAILGIIGVFGLFSDGASGPIWVPILLIVGAVLWYLKGAKHIVVLSSASGEAEAISSGDAQWIGRIIGALNDSIIDRG